jgi:hypothetical protein
MTMTWTTDKPRRTGWYWYSATPDAEPKETTYEGVHTRPNASACPRNREW